MVDSSKFPVNNMKPGIKRWQRPLLGGLLAASLGACGFGTDDGPDAGAGAGSTNIEAPRYSVSGSVAGLSGTAVLQLNGANDLALSGEGIFAFPEGLLGAGDTYTLSLGQYEAGQDCTVTPDSGQIAADVTDVEVVCAGSAATYAYATSFGESKIYQYSVGSDGVLTPLATATVDTGDAPQNILGLASGKAVYVADSNEPGLRQFSIGEDGSLVLMEPATVWGGQTPMGLAVHPSKDIVYLANYTYGAYQYSIDGDGALTPMDPAMLFLGGYYMRHVIHPDGHTLYGSAYYIDGVYALALDGDGKLPAVAPASVSADTGTHPWGLDIEPTGKYLYVANLDGASVSQYTIDANGDLTPMTPAEVAAEAGSQHVTVHPSGKYVYVANSSAGTISQYTIGPDGALAPMVPATVSYGVAPAVAPAVVTLDAAGIHAYVPDENSGYIYMFDVGETGGLTLKSPVSEVAAGAGMAYMTIVTPDPD